MSTQNVCIIQTGIQVQNRSPCNNKVAGPQMIWWRIADFIALILWHIADLMTLILWRIAEKDLQL